MYQLIEIIEGDATRFLKLKNLDTGVIEECFDDSAVVSGSNFNFMQIGQKYECKIKLFGKPVADETNNCVTCKLINDSIDIGQKSMVEVQVNNNKYYIVKQRIKKYLDCDSFFFRFTRKGLVQVNDIVHADLFRNI